jgi:hypothetical protein
MDGEFASYARHAREDILAALTGDPAKLDAQSLGLVDDEAWRIAWKQEATVQADIDALRENYGRGWRYCHMWSAAEPDGLLSSAHVSYLTKIEPAELGAALSRGWRPA